MNKELAKEYFIKGLNELSAKRYTEAEASFRKSLEILPGRESTLTNLSAVLLKLKKYEECQKITLELINENDLNYQAWLNYGASKFGMGNFQEAIIAYNKCISINVNYAEAWSNLGNVFQELKQYEQSITSYKKAISINPDYAEAWSNLGNVFQALKQYKQSLTSYNKAISINPDHAEAWFNRGNALQHLNQYEQSLASYDKAISINSDYAEAWSNRGNLLISICHYDLAEASFREAIRIDPNNLISRNSLLFSLNYFPSPTHQLALAEAKLYGSKVSISSTPKFTSFNTPINSKRLRIGFMSGDLHNHPVGYFVEGLIEKLDPIQFELHAFPTRILTDDLTDRIRPFFSKWTPIYGISDFDAASLIHQAGIHVLIDLSGHTAHNRLPVFSFKPAPTQVSWLGYFATTGLPEMDYFLGDPYTSPVNEENQFSEAIWWLDKTWFCMKPPNYQLPVSELPAKINGFITFGSLSNISKVNDEVLATWAAVLHRIPSSKLFMKAKQLDDSVLRGNLLKKFKALEISADRIIFEGLESREYYFKSYNKIDIILDTFPYPGGTTSVDALWMGVPVLTMKGNRFLSHLGESIAINSGNADWIAEDIENYVEKAVEFSINIELLAQLRNSLRGRVLESPLFDNLRFAKDFGDALWGMWNQCVKVFLNDK